MEGQLSTVADMETLGERTEAADYFAEVEEHFSRLRGRPLLLSPRDVALVKQWHEAGVPRRVVQKAVERFFGREARRERPRRRAPTIEWCERDVYELWEEWKAAHLGDEEPQSGPSPAAVLRARIETLGARLAPVREEAAARGARRVARALGKVLAARQDRLGLCDQNQVAELERECAEDEARVLRAARHDLGEAALAELREEVRRQVEPHRSGIDAKAYVVLLAKTEDRALLRRFGIPRIALFSF